MTKGTGPSMIERVMENSEAMARPDDLDSIPSSVEREGNADSTSSPEGIASVEKVQRGEANEATSSPPPGKSLPAFTATPERNRIFAGSTGDGASARFDMLRTQIVREMSAKGWRTLGITSPMPRCGTTTVAINLCISIAKGIRQDIVLVDLNLRHPTIASYLGLDTSPDLSDYLAGNVSFRRPFMNSGIPRLLIIPNRKAHRDSSETLTSHAAVSLAQSLRAMEDVQIVVYDLPPILPTDDTLAFMPELDCVLLVLADGVTTKEELEDSREMLKHTNVLGYVLNQLS